MESALLYTLGVVIFFLAIVVSIALHELGHLFFAKKFGARVTDYFVGFGPTLWSKKKGETEYGIKAVPLGGFIRIIGMVPPDKRHPDKIRESNTGMFTQVISNARAADLELIRPEDEARLFYKLPWWKKFTVMAAGPSVNILIAFFIFMGLFMTYGDRKFEPVEGGPVTLIMVDECLIPWDEQRFECKPGDQEAPAYAAGFRPGDRLLSFNGQPIESWERDMAVVQENLGESFTAVVLRDGKELTLTGATSIQERPNRDTLDPDDTVKVGFLGVTPEHEWTITHGGPIYTAKWMGDRTVEVFHSFKVLPEKISNVALAIVGQEERDPTGPVSVVGGSRFVGETVASDEPTFTLASKTAFVASMIGAFNLFIGIFNFLPVLPLDGGHMAGALWEGLRRRGAKLLRRPDPGPFDIAKLMPVAQVVGMALFALGMLLIVGDFVAPIRIS